MNKLFVLIAVIVVCFCVNVKAEERKLTAPKLTSVERVDEFTLKLKWSKVENAKNLTRYRIFYERNDEDKFHEWPAQITRTKTEAVQTRDYVSFSFDNAFDCYKDCIKNPMCTFAIYKSITDKLSGENCFFKTREKASNNTSNLFDENYEFVRISPYTNEATLTGISTADYYKFSIFVYDTTLDSWSPESNNLEYKGQKLSIGLEYETKNNKNIKFSWKKNSQFTVSRYNLILSTSENPNSQSIPVSAELTKFKFDPNYYETVTIDASTTCESEEDCFKKCADMSDCVRYMHSKELKTCKLYKKFDSATGRLVPMNAVAFSVKSTAKEFTLKSKLVKKSGNYSVKIEFIDSFGSARYSNSINLTIIKSEDGEDEIEEKTTTTVKSITADKPIETVDYNENENETIEYEVETETQIAGITTIDPNSIIEANIDDGELTLNQNSTQILKVNEQFSVSCSWTGSPNTKLVWTKKDDTSRKLSIKKSSYEQGSTYELIFSKLSREDEGVYTCSLQDNAETHLTLNLMVKDVPSKPTIKTASLSKNGLFIEWTLENNGGADLTKAIIELSPDFSNQSITVQEAAFVGASLKQNQAILNQSINVESKIRVTVENVMGLSEISDITPIKCLETNCTDLTGTQTVIKKKSVKRQSLIYVLIIAGILAIALLVYAAVQCLGKSKSKKEPNNGDDRPLVDQKKEND